MLQGIWKIDQMLQYHCSLKIKSVSKKSLVFLKKSGGITFLVSRNPKVFHKYQTYRFFATLVIIVKECCRDFEKFGKCCNVHIAMILILLKCCKDSENFEHLEFKCCKKNVRVEGEVCQEIKVLSISINCKGHLPWINNCRMTWHLVKSLRAIYIFV